MELNRTRLTNFIHSNEPTTLESDSYNSSVMINSHGDLRLEPETKKPLERPLKLGYFEEFTRRKWTEKLMDDQDWSMGA